MHKKLYELQKQCIIVCKYTVLPNVVESSEVKTTIDFLIGNGSITIQCISCWMCANHLSVRILVIWTLLMERVHILRTLVIMYSC